jgi:hypothetical protein
MATGGIAQNLAILAILTKAGLNHWGESGLDPGIGPNSPLEKPRHIPKCRFPDVPKCRDCSQISARGPARLAGPTSPKGITQKLAILAILTGGNGL